MDPQQKHPRVMAAGVMAALALAIGGASIASGATSASPSTTAAPSATTTQPSAPTRADHPCPHDKGTGASSPDPQQAPTTSSPTTTPQT